MSQDDLIDHIEKCDLCRDMSKNGFCLIGQQLWDEGVSMAYGIAQQFYSETNQKTCPRCKESWDESGGCQDPECPCNKR